MEPLNVVRNKKVLGVTLKEFIKERRLLKTKFKLMQIELLDKDIKNLNQEGLTLNNLNLENIWLTNSMQIVCTAEIIPIEENHLKLTSYLIYLSYLYEIDLLSLDQNELGIVLSKLKMPKEIKRNLYTLMSNGEGAYFSDCIETMNSSLYRENTKEDKLILQRSVK